MTYSDPTPPPLAAAAAPSWETCDHCQAPLAERQRYCVVCGARRPHADDPAARWVVVSARRARAVAAAPPPAAASAGDAGSRLRFALVFALLPLVAALGIVVGRGSGGDQQLVDALRAQKAPVVNVIGGGGAGAGATDTGGPGAGSSSGRVGKSDPVNGDVIAKTRSGSARRLTGASVTPQEIQQSRAALQRIVDSKGRAYVDQQRNLPDQIVIP